MKYVVMGADRDTGETVELIVEATSENEATDKANKRNMLVAECKVASNGGNGPARSIPQRSRFKIFAGAAVVALILIAVALSWGLHPKKLAANKDFYQDPSTILTPAFAPYQVALSGVKIDDPESAISRERIKKPKNEYGWVECSDGTAYRVEDGKVSVLLLRDRSVIAKMNLAGIAGIERVLGVPERVKANYLGLGGSFISYDVRSTEFELMSDGTINSVRIVKAPASGDKAQVRQFIASYSPFVRELRSIQSGVKDGITFDDFDKKYQNLRDALAQAEKPNEDNQIAKDFGDCARRILDAYQRADLSWRTSIEQPLLAPQTSRQRDKAWEDAAREVKTLLSTFDRNGQ